MKHRYTLIAIVLALLCVVVWFSLPHPLEGRPGDDWMLTGCYSWRGGKGISRYLVGSDEVRAAGFAAGPLRGASLPQIFGQIRDQWPSARGIWKGVQNPAFLAVHPNRSYIYSADENTPGAVTSFRLDIGTGGLTALNTKPSGGAKPCYLTMTPDGRHLLVANYGGSVAVLPVAEDGRLGEPASVIQYPSGSQAHSIVLSPDARFAIVADAGLAKLHVYRFDGGLTWDNDALPDLPHDSRPRHLVFHPNGTWAYLITESSTVIAMRWDAGKLTHTQTIGTLPPDFRGESGAAEIEVHPNGRFLYASNRGHDSIVVFAIDQKEGTLSAIQDIPSGGKQPASFRIGPEGKSLFVANVLSNNIAQFRIDAQTGLLAPAAPPLTVSAPVGIRFVKIAQPELR